MRPDHGRRHHHKFREVKAFAETVTVPARRGRLIARRRPRVNQRRNGAEMMVGKREGPASSSTLSRAPGRRRLRLEKLCVADHVGQLAIAGSILGDPCRRDRGRGPAVSVNGHRELVFPKKDGAGRPATQAVWAALLVHARISPHARRCIATNIACLPLGAVRNACVAFMSGGREHGRLLISTTSRPPPPDGLLRSARRCSRTGAQVEIEAYRFKTRRPSADRALSPAACAACRAACARTVFRKCARLTWPSLLRPRLRGRSRNPLPNRSMSQRGAAVLLVSEDLDEIRNCPTASSVMSDGPPRKLSLLQSISFILVLGAIGRAMAWALTSQLSS